MHIPHDGRAQKPRERTQFLSGRAAYFLAIAIGCAARSVSGAERWVRSRPHRVCIYMYPLRNVRSIDLKYTYLEIWHQQLSNNGFKPFYKVLSEGDMYLCMYVRSPTPDVIFASSRSIFSELTRSLAI